MINLLLPGFLTKGLPRLKFCLTTPRLFSSYSQPHYHPKSLEAISVILIAQQWEEAGDSRPEDEGGKGPWRPVHLCSVTSALTGVSSALQLPLATVNVGSVLWLPCVQSEPLAESPLQQTKLQLGPCLQDGQLSLGDFRDLEKGRRTCCLAVLLLSTLCHPGATIGQCCVPVAGKGTALP